MVFATKFLQGTELIVFGIVNIENSDKQQVKILKNSNINAIFV